MIGLGLALQAQAFDKNQVNLVNDFFGTWTVYNAKTQCTETYQFVKPEQFSYTTKQKKMTGDFAVLRNKGVKNPEVIGKVASQIKQRNANKKILVAGYTDRLGSIQYNQQLSAARANTVVELLKQQGIPADQIEYSAESKTDVYQKCTEMNKKIQLVECLAPNRRVNITW